MSTSKPYRALLVASAVSLAGVGCSGAPANESVDDRLQPIVGGELDSAHTNVFGLLIRKQGGLATCSSTLLAPNLLLTARHCVASEVQDPVICGASRLGVAAAPENVFAANSMALQRDARWFHAAEVHVPTEGDDTCGYDVALIVLTENVPSTLAVPAVPRIDRDVAVGESYVAVGYGLDENGSAGDRRSRSDLAVSCEPGSCGFGVRVSEFIGDTGVCQGDSGGPAFDDDGKVVGVVSRGAEDCGSPIYSTVTAWRDLIEEVGAHAAELGGYTAPFWVTSGNSDAPTPPPPPPKLAAVDEACSATVACVEGAACFRASPDTNPVCAQLCSSDGECADGTACQPVGDGSSSVCLATPKSKHSPGSGCALGGTGSTASWPALMGLLGLVGIWRRRRAALRPGRFDGYAP